MAVITTTFCLRIAQRGDIGMADNEGNEKGATEPTGETGTTGVTEGDNSVTEPVLDTKSINSRLDGIEDMIQRLTGSLQKVTDAQSVLLQSGAVIDTNDTDPSDDDGVKAFNDPSFDTLDLRITD